jgi:dipeptidyl aminopeptidase/acylaminoacyl peptidase
MWKRFLLACALGLTAGCGGFRDIETRQLEATAPSAPVRFFYDTEGGKAEAFLVRPEGRGPFPLIVLLHGHNRNGSGAQVLRPVAELFANKMCYAALAVSLPGYGATQVANGGDRDVVAGVLADGIADATKLSWIDPKRILLYGFSRGAVFGASSVSRLPRLRAVILHSGAYDLAQLYQDTSASWVRQVLNPTGDANPKLFNVLPEVDKWRTPTLVLHGAKDGLLPVNQAKMLDERLATADIPHRTVIFPDAGHRLPLDGVAQAVFAFLQQYVGGACATNGR